MKTSCEVERDTEPLADMYGTAGMPELLPPSAALRPNPSAPYTPGHGAIQRAGSDSLSQPRRAPKLGQIGRSKRVVIDDEDLDDIMNNNRNFPVSISVSPVA